MIQWEYQITIHELPESQGRPQGTTIECDQNGHCFVHDVYQIGLDWLESLFREKGERGWELGQSGYHNRELLYIWKKRKEDRKGD